jgi:peroxiredoxin
MSETSPVCDFGWKAPGFRLPATDGRTYALADIRGTRGTLVMFICNHCPYVQAVLDRIVRDVRELDAAGVRSVAISSNDAVSYPEDSFERMQAAARAYAFPFPYLYDETQDVARAYGAVCTPEFFGFNAALELQYRGRIDASGRDAAPPDARRELFEAMKLVAETGKGPPDQRPSIGCSIKWKDD